MRRGANKSKSTAEDGDGVEIVNEIVNVDAVTDAAVIVDDGTPTTATTTTSATAAAIVAVPDAAVAPDHAVVRDAPLPNEALPTIIGTRRQREELDELPVRNPPETIAGNDVQLNAAELAEFALFRRWRMMLGTTASSTSETVFHAPENLSVAPNPQNAQPMTFPMNALYMPFSHNPTNYHHQYQHTEYDTHRQQTHSEPLFPTPPPPPPRFAHALLRGSFRPGCDRKLLRTLSAEQLRERNEELTKHGLNAEFPLEDEF